MCVILTTRILWPRFPSFLCKGDYKCISKLFSIILILVTERTNNGVSWGVTDTQKNSLKHARYKWLQKAPHPVLFMHRRDVLILLVLYVPLNGCDDSKSTEWRFLSCLMLDSI